MKIQVEVWASFTALTSGSCAGLLNSYTFESNDQRQRRLFGEQSTNALAAGQCVVTHVLLEDRQSTNRRG